MSNDSRLIAPTPVPATITMLTNEIWNKIFVLASPQTTRDHMLEPKEFVDDEALLHHRKPSIAEEGIQLSGLRRICRRLRAHHTRDPVC